MDIKLKELEELESKYLSKYFYFLKFAEDDLIRGFKSKFDITNDWYYKWNPKQEGKGISDFSTGAERIVYSLLNGRGIGSPNSAPIGSDLFFEVEDAFIHLDLKTVQTRNISDYQEDIFIGNNQNSYNGKLDVRGKEMIYDEACLPHYYSPVGRKRKPCLTYFITILYEETELEILNINILSMPNGALYPIYGKSVLKAGKTLYPKGNPKTKTHRKTVRYKWVNNIKFDLLENKNRVKVIFFNEKMNPQLRSKLKIINKLYEEQKKIFSE